MNGASIFFLAVLWFSEPPESVAEGFFREGWAPLPTESLEDCLQKRTNVLTYLSNNKHLWEGLFVKVGCYYLNEDLATEMYEQYQENTKSKNDDIAI